VRGLDGELRVGGLSAGLAARRSALRPPSSSSPGSADWYESGHDAFWSRAMERSTVFSRDDSANADRLGRSPNRSSMSNEGIGDCRVRWCRAQVDCRRPCRPRLRPRLRADLHTPLQRRRVVWTVRASCRRRVVGPRCSPRESPFASVRLRTGAAKRFKRVEHATALMCAVKGGVF
jgi:hypothetical protein